MKQTDPGYAVISMYTKFDDIFVRQSQGRYTNLRWLCVWLTQLVFYGLPWLNWHQRPAVLFDLATRKFYLFSLVLFPQDFIYLAVLLIICAYGLFLFTAVSGRVWCGFSCPQTVYTELFMWIENKIEGSRSRRMRLARQTMNAEKFLRKSAKHLVWGLLSLWTGLSFVAYFVPVQTLMTEILTLSLAGWSLFWILFYALATYGNAGFMREQICRYVCPYARFQGSMLDQDSLVVSYDKARGEPRKRSQDGAAAAGACIDCSMCVQVCPTGIDIRNGLQHDCIGCAACIDACDTVMDKTGQPRGLIRYSTERAMQQGLNAAQIWQRVARPRVLIYSLILLAICIAFISSLNQRIPLRLNVLRDRNVAGREVGLGGIENVYRLHIMNTDSRSHQYQLSVDGIDGLQVIQHEALQVAPASARTIPLTLRLSAGSTKPGLHPLQIDLRASDDERISVHEKSSFNVPAH